MTILSRRRLNGKAYNVTTGSGGGSAPGQVGSLAAGTATASTIPVTYTAASGATSYQGYTSPHGAGTWTLNAGTFGATGGTFSGLAATTDYDLRVVASNTYGSSTTDLLTGVTTTSASGGASGAVQSFTLADWSGSGSVGFARQGMVFKQGDVPAGHVPVIQRNSATVAHQWNQVATYPDGSWKFAVFSLRDTAFSASESRTYAVVQQAGSVPATTGLTLPQAVAGHTFQVKFTSVNSYDGTNTVAYNSGALTSDLTTHIATSTRITKMADGPIAPCWKIWGMAGGDAHLKTNWYVIPWLNADGSVYAIELCALNAQDWWSIAGKYQLQYNAVLVDGGTTINSFSGVNHYYGSHWAMLRATQDNNYCRAPWIGGAMPTLTYGFQKTYWHDCGPIPPMSSTLVPTALGSLPPFVPCQGTSSDVMAVDGTGASGSRGLITGWDGIAYARQDAADYAYVRCTATNTIHAPWHYRSNRTRTRLGDNGVADTANSVCTLILAPLSTAANDFTADGLPVAVHAYSDGATASGWADGYVAASGGTGSWHRDYPDSSHLYAYAYMNYIFEGSPWVLESGIIDWSMYSVQQQAGQNFANRNVLLYHYKGQPGYTFAANMPDTMWTGIGAVCGSGNIRAAGWEINLIGQAAGITWVGHEAQRFLMARNANQADWIAQSLAYMPASMQNYGLWSDLSPVSWYGLVNTTIDLVSPWQMSFIAQGAYFNYQLTGASGYKALGDMVANHSIGLVNQGCYYTSAYRAPPTSKIGLVDFGTGQGGSDFLSWGNVGFANFSAALTAGSATIALGGQTQEGYPSPCVLPLAAGDIVRITPAYDIGNDTGTIPSEVPEGQPLYVTTPSSATTMQVATSPGGTPIVWSESQSIALTFLPASANVSVATSPPYIPGGDCYAFFHYGVLVFAERNGKAGANAARTKMDRFLTNANRATYMPTGGLTVTA